MIYHVYTDYLPKDYDTIRRNNLAQQSWKNQPWWEVPVKDIHLPRMFNDGDRRFAFIKDILDVAAERAKELSDVIVYTNADIMVRSDCCDAILKCLKQSDACYAFRRDFIRLDTVIPDSAFKTGHDYVGSDLIAFTKGWWVKNRDEFVDGLLGGEAWDPCSRILIEETNPGKEISVRDIICHEKHNSFWERQENRYSRPFQHYSIKVACAFFAKRGKDPRQFGIPDWYLQKYGLFKKEKSPVLKELSKTGKVFFHSGDLGDIIAALPVMRQLGGGHLVLGRNEAGGTREHMTRARASVIEPLLHLQPYVMSVSYEDGANMSADYDFSSFRQIPTNDNLSILQARHLGLSSVDMSPWLKVKPSSSSKGKVVCSRSLRWQSAEFPWQKYLEGKEVLFIGVKEEFDSFSKVWPSSTWVPTSNLLQAAELIAGSDLFVGNQSCPLWLAMALGHHTVRELIRANMHHVPTPWPGTTELFGPLEVLIHQGHSAVNPTAAVQELKIGTTGFAF